MTLAGCAGDPNPMAPPSAPSFTDDPSPQPTTVTLPVSLTELQALSDAFSAAGTKPGGVLEGPGLLVGLGRDLVELRVGEDGNLPEAQLTWAGCRDCTDMGVADMLLAYRADASSPDGVDGVTRRTGPGASALDPRGDSLLLLPSLVTYVEDPSAGSWRTWYLVTNATGQGVVALLAETGPLPVAPE